MPKALKKNYYAVCKGRGGPAIYNSWDECKANTTRYAGAKHKGFSTYQDAQVWLTSQLALDRNSSSASNSDIEFTSFNPTPPASKSQQMQDVSGDSDIEFVDPPSPPASTLTASVEPPEINLSPEQKKVLNKVKNGRNVFFTGSAGTGKSVLLREIIQHFSQSNKNVAITASTGIAAVNIGGSTIHSWAGIGLGDDEVDKYVGKFRGNKKFRNVRDRWFDVKALIIDESERLGQLTGNISDPTAVSMLDGDLFDKLEFIARELRKDASPFGGIQLILSGDFCQLPPVPNKRNGKVSLATFAFEAQSWDRCVGPPTVLKKVFRQKDQSFINMLNEMRFGDMSEKTIKTFRSLDRVVHYEDGVQPTQLYPRREQVDHANRTRLAELSGEMHSYVAMDIPGTDSDGKQVTLEHMGRLLDRLVVPKFIHLKVGAQVMLNLHQGSLVNGSVGVVTTFLTRKAAKKRGISAARVESGQNEPFHQPYAAEEDEEKEEESNEASKARLWPVIQFTNGKELFFIPLDFTVNTPLGTMEARREQVPLILAWALSIHKSQGQTLERVKVDLGQVFEKGQAYVALSRATNLKTLEVKNFDPSKVVAHSKVLAKVVEWQGFIPGASRAPAPPPAEHNIDEEMDDFDSMAMYQDGF
ncbi:hypothetical protein D9757_006264 [Collybiopsis confluens]|uniref:ATP-dependent DNA helicase PIF1 n=1 Tax=Collybiopsis confluens TaxID=2823264 RepID=A0A8H5M8P6_9AGAR|nr:hypothetical protein D9757_006264 [Collybiopsis confluens]